MSLQKVTALVCHGFVYGVRGQTPAPPSDFSGTANRGLSLIATGTYFLKQVPA